jgi:hypothetical protein
MTKCQVAVLGAGIMGSCLALECAQRGFLVDLYDLEPAPMTGASLQNEGKLHLGFVYAKDTTNETQKVMVRGSLSFSRIIEKLTGSTVREFHQSEPFRYFIPRDSQLDMISIEKHFQNVQSLLDKTIKATGDNYLNLTTSNFYYKNPPQVHEQYFSNEHTLGSFTTEERSVSTQAIARIITNAIFKQKNIRFHGNSHILSVKRSGLANVEVTVGFQGLKSAVFYPVVVNCLWDDKLRIDKTAGIPESGPWILRYKAMIRITAPGAKMYEIPSATGILGLYGDIVNHLDGTYYLSWYPLCKLGESLNEDGRKLHEKTHPFLIQDIKKVISRNPEMSRRITNFTHRRFIRNNIKSMVKYVPSLRQLLTYGTECKISGGVILARGKTDIDDPLSYLHQRSNIGPMSYGGYITVDTGKYCTAPLFALETADMVSEIFSREKNVHQGNSCNTSLQISPFL